MIIDGQVQGVGYRASLAAKAASLGLAGWVRNRFDGTVEACVQGDEAQINSLIAWAKIGPPAAIVGKVMVTDSDETVLPGGKFGILPTR